MYVRRSDNLRSGVVVREPQRDEHKQDGFLVHMPAEHVRCESTQRERSDEGLVGCVRPELAHVYLRLMTSASALLFRNKQQELTVWKATVIANVWIGLTAGMTAKTVSPTRPREVEATPDVFTLNLLS